MSESAADHGNDPAGSVAAFVGGEPVSWDELLSPLAEAAGGRVLGELALDRLIAVRLAERGLKVRPQQSADEEASLLRALDDRDESVAARLLRQFRRERGLGKQRYARLLARNAGLRALVEDKVLVSPQAVRDEYERRYGTRYEARLIVTGTLDSAHKLAERARNGETFADLAIANSLDSSSDQGGLLPLISPADPTFPEAIRASLGKMQVGQVSQPIMLEAGFAILRLERIVKPNTVPFEEVRPSLTEITRERATRKLMRELARSLLSGADIVVLDPALKNAWDHQRAAAFD